MRNFLRWINSLSAEAKKKYVNPRRRGNPAFSHRRKTSFIMNIYSTRAPVVACQVGVKHVLK